MGIEATNMCQYDHIYSWLKAGIDGAIHGVQAIWNSKPLTEIWVILIVNAKMHSTKSITLEFCGQFAIYGSVANFLTLLLSLVIAHLAEWEWDIQFTSQ